MQIPPNFSLSMLRQRRKANGFPKQTDVAEYLGRQVNTIKLLESRGVLPRGDAQDWVKLQRVYGLTIEDFAHLQKMISEGKINGFTVPVMSEKPANYELEKDQ